MQAFKAFFQWIIIGIVMYCASAASKPTEAKKERYARSILFENRWPDPDPTIVQFPHQSSCHHYYVVLSADDITIKRCPHGELFDYKTHDCVSKEVARCWSQHFGKLKHTKHIHLHKKRKHFRCPTSWGKYPNIYDCTKYYQCLNGKAKHKKCGPYEYFDKIAGKCVAEIKAICADETDVVEHGYKCPRSWGLFPFQEDCSKYYECFQGKPVLKTCKMNTVFDQEKRKCMQKEQAKCILEDISEGKIHPSFSTEKTTERTTSVSENPSSETIHEDKSISFDPPIPTDPALKTSLIISSTAKNETVNKINSTTSVSSENYTKRATPIIVPENSPKESLYEVQSISSNPQISTDIDVKTSLIISSTAKNETVNKINSPTLVSSEANTESNFFFLSR